MAENQYEQIRTLTAVKGEGAITIDHPIQSSAQDFDKQWGQPRVNVYRNWIVTGNGKKQYKLTSSDGTQDRNSGSHNHNDYKEYAALLDDGDVPYWSTFWTGNADTEAELIQIGYKTQRMASDYRAPKDMEEYGSRDDYYGKDRVAYYNRYMEWKEAGYPIIVTVYDACSSWDSRVVLEEYTMTIADATATVRIQDEVDVVIVEIKNYDCPHCGAKYASYAGRYNHFKKNQCRVLNSQE